MQYARDPFPNCPLLQGFTVIVDNVCPGGYYLPMGQSANAEREPSPLHFLDLTKPLTRHRHLELLVFEMLMLLEKTWATANELDEETLVSSHEYQVVRELYKTLAHGRGMDGRKY